MPTCPHFYCAVEAANHSVPSFGSGHSMEAGYLLMSFKAILKIFFVDVRHEFSSMRTCLNRKIGLKDSQSYGGTPPLTRYADVGPSATVLGTCKQQLGWDTSPRGSVLSPTPPSCDWKPFFFSCGLQHLCDHLQSSRGHVKNNHGRKKPTRDNRNPI